MVHKWQMRFVVLQVCSEFCHLYPLWIMVPFAVWFGSHWYFFLLVVEKTNLGHHLQQIYFDTKLVHDFPSTLSLQSKTQLWLRYILMTWCRVEIRDSWCEPRHVKTNKMAVRPAKTQISLGICPIWSESSLFAWRKLGSLATHWVHSEDWSDWADAQADLSLRWAHTHFVGFVMSSGSHTGRGQIKNSHFRVRDVKP